MLMPDEQFFLRLPEIASLPLKPYTEVEHVGETKFSLDERAIGQAYAAWLGFYKSWLKPLRWTSAELVKQGAVWARCLGWQGVIGSSGGSGWTPPPIAKRTVGMMGLRGTPGLNVVDHLDDGDDTAVRSGGGGRGRGQPRQQGVHGNKTKRQENGRIKGGKVIKN